MQHLHDRNILIIWYVEEAYISKKRLSYALSLADRISQIQLPSKNKATVDACQGVYIQPAPKKGKPVVCNRQWVCYIAFGVGFCVARSTVMGNARAKVCGTSNRYSCPAFFMSARLTIIPYHVSVGVAAERPNNTHYVKEKTTLRLTGGTAR